MTAFLAEPLVVAKNRGAALGAGAVGHQLILAHGGICLHMSVYFVAGNFVPQFQQNSGASDNARCSHSPHSGGFSGFGGEGGFAFGGDLASDGGLGGGLGRGGGGFGFAFGGGGLGAVCCLRGGAVGPGWVESSWPMTRS